MGESVALSGAEQPLALHWRRFRNSGEGGIALHCSFMACFTFNGFVVLKKPHGVYEVSLPHNQARAATLPPAPLLLAVALLRCTYLVASRISGSLEKWVTAGTVLTSSQRCQRRRRRRLAQHEPPSESSALQSMSSTKELTQISLTTHGRLRD